MTIPTPGSQEAINKGCTMTEDHTCKMRYKGIREVLGHPVEMWECTICGRESIIPYSGTQDTIEWRD